LSPGQFEPWSSKADELMGYTPNSAQYKKAASIVDGIISGQIQDPTGGATKFYSPTAQAAVGRAPPAWDDGTGKDIGKHRFFGGASDPFSDYGIGTKVAPTVGQQPSPANVPSRAAPPQGPSDPFEDYGVATPGVTYADQDHAAMVARMQKSISAPPAASQDPYSGGFDRSQPLNIQAYKIARDTGQYLGSQAAGIPKAVVGDYQAANALANAGMTEMARGNILPSFPSTNPETWQGGGVLKTAAGLAGQVFSPVTGLVRKATEEPVAAEFGPDVGERAGFVANSLVGPTIGKLGTNALASTLPGTRAIAQAKSVLGKVPDPEMVARLQANPNLRLIDVEPTLQAHALGLAAEPSYPAFGILKTSANETNAAARPAATAAYNMAMGETPNVKTLLDQLEATKKSNAQQGYGAAFENSKPVDISPVVEQLSKIENPTGISRMRRGAPPPTTAQSTATDIKSMLTGENGTRLVDPQQLHEIQSQLRVAAEREVQRGGMESSIRAQQLNSARSGIIKALDEATEGKYSQARVKYREDSSIPEAFDKGMTINKNATIEDRPEYWEDWKKNASPEEVEAARLGMRVEADRQINGSRFGARNAANIPETPFNFEKMKIILGDKEATELANHMSDAKAVAATNALLFSGSKTAIGEAAKRATAVRQGNTLNVLGPGTGAAILAHLAGGGNLGSLAAGLAGMGSNKLGQMSDIGRNTVAARLYSMPGIQALEQIYKAPSSAIVRNALTAPSSALLGARARNESVNALTSSNSQP
jgi:hypothetical protein